MILDSQGLVLGSFPHGETSAIIRVFTKEQGKSSFLFKGLKKNKAWSALARPGFCVQISFYKGQSGLHLAKNIQAHSVFHHIFKDSIKTCQILFVCDVLNLLLPENYEDSRLYDRLHYLFTELNAIEKDLNFHVRTLIELCGHLGVEPEQNQWHEFIHTKTKDPILTQIFDAKFILQEISLNNPQRREAIQLLISYLNEKLDLNMKPKSLDVLTDVFSEF